MPGIVLLHHGDEQNNVGECAPGRPITVDIERVVRPLPSRRPNPPDMAIVPGASTTVSTRAGAFILGEAGLVNGRRASPVRTHAACG
jgi:hypothetical protein